MEDETKSIEPRLLCTQQAAKLLGVSPSFLNKLRCEGGGPVFVRLGRAVRYRDADLRSWVASRRFRNTLDHASIKVEA